MFTKRDLIEYINSTIGGYECGIDTGLRKSEVIKDISLESWCDYDLLHYVAMSKKMLASDILDDYCRRITQYMTLSSTEKGKDIFYSALMNATMLWEDLSMTYGDEL